MCRRFVFLGWLLKANLTECVAGIWVYARGLCLPKDFRLWCMLSSKKWGTVVIEEPWPNAFGANMPWDVSLAEKVETVQACFTLIEGEGLRAQRDYHTKQTLSAMDEQPIKRLLELSEVIMWHNWISWYVQLGCRTTTILHRHYYKWNIPKYNYYYFSVIAYTHELKK